MIPANMESFGADTASMFLTYYGSKYTDTDDVDVAPRRKAAKDKPKEKKPLARKPRTSLLKWKRSVLVAVTRPPTQRRMRLFTVGIVMTLLRKRKAARPESLEAMPLIERYEDL